MKIASFNVNSLRVRMEVVVDWLAKNSPDVLCVQETKVQDVDFPSEAIEAAGYEYIFKGQKSYNGVAIFGKSKMKDVKIGFDDEPADGPRLIKAKIGGVVVVNTYVPQGYERDSEKFEYKLQWFKRLRKYFESNFKTSDKIVWVGDLNIAPEDRDVYDPEAFRGHVCFCDEVSAALSEVMDWGFVDVFRKHCDQAGEYTYWDYRMHSVSRNNGWRLDHIMATKPLAKKSTACYIDKEPRLVERPSDHTPIVAEFEISKK